MCQQPSSGASGGIGSGSARRREPWSTWPWPMLSACGVQHSSVTSRSRSRRFLQPSLHMDKFRDECGVFGIFGHPEAANLTYLGLYALQHRGQESAGIACADGHRVLLSRAMGEVNDCFDQAKLATLVGDIAIGHVRYSTAGSSRIENAQPMLVD